MSMTMSRLKALIQTLRTTAMRKLMIQQARRLNGA
jgi:hypothetical protein